MKRLVLGGLLLIVALTVQAQDSASLLEVTARVETVASPGDGATTPVLWVHPTDPALSLIIGADDNEGIGVYGLDGALLQFVDEPGSVSALDMRYNVAAGSRPVDLVAAALEDQPVVALYRIDPATRTLEPAGQIATGVPLAAVCLYHSDLTATDYVFAISDTGQLEQHALNEDDGQWSATLRRKMDVGGEVEACTVDDPLRRLYVTEGDNLVWRYGAEPEDGIGRGIVDIVGPRISEEIEGLAIYAAADNQGYLIVTNEKADTFLLYERTGDNAPVGEFKIVAGEHDAVSEPTGIYAVGRPVGELFPQGVFLTSDDVNSQPNADNNFKLVSWGDIAAGLNLVADTTYDPRQSRTAAPAPADRAAGVVTARVETQPVPSGIDAADDPAIWIHPTDTTRSTIIGTDKTAGLVVYDLEGTILQEINIGRVNNVDLRYNFPLAGEQVALVGTTNRTFNSLALFTIDPATRRLTDAAAGAIVSGVEEVYGFCFYISPVSGGYYAFINSADTGQVEQYALTDDGRGKIAATLVRQFVVGSQTEGCAADDETGALYIGEEAVGLWRYSAEPDADDSRTLIDSTGPGGNLTADVEGVVIYYAAGGAGYLLVSSQGSSDFAVYDRQGDHAYLGRFRVIESAATDAVSGTDGLDVTNFPLNATFPDGLVVVQDDLNINPEESQNFKLVPWGDIAAALNLRVDTTFDPRQIGR